MTVFTNCLIFDGENNKLIQGHSVYISDDKIVEVSERPITPDDNNVINCGGHILMPGLIDAHIHAYASDLNFTKSMKEPPTLFAHHASRMLSKMLERGFTSARDTGGADYGLFLAIEREWIKGPRLFYCERALSQTGGHGDFRHHYEHEHKNDLHCCSCNASNHISHIVTGEDTIRRAVRENLRRGASFIKFMGSGGVSSPSDPLENMQFSDEEIRVIVDEVERHGVYCTAHIHADEALRRAIHLGVHCIEHGTLIEADTSRMAADSGTYIVPTLSIISALSTEGEKLGFPLESLKKLDKIKNEALARILHMKEAGVKIGFGTDLLGTLERHQCAEFSLRSPVFSNFEILTQVTAINGEILGQKNKLGVIKPGAYADILLVDGNPLEDISVCSSDGAHFLVIMKGGKFFRNKLNP